MVFHWAVCLGVICKRRDGVPLGGLSGVICKRRDGVPLGRLSGSDM